jgi:DNA-binding transcriptional LysR family regulator
MESPVDRLASMEIFDKVVACRNFSAAARQLRLSQAAVSKHVQALEDWVGARLLNRTTRRLSLTEAGAAFHKYCARILEEVAEGKEAAAATHVLPRGTLRFTAPIPFGTAHLPSVLQEYAARYPDVALEVALTDRRVDIVEEGFDLAIRVGPLPDSTLIARPIARSRFVLCAAPSYLRKRGEPRRPAELCSHDCLVFSHHGQQGPSVWEFAGRHGPESVEVAGRLKSNNADLLLAAAVSGAGIFLAPSFHVAEELRKGRLLSLLPDHVRAESVIQAVYPYSRHLSAKVRAFVDLLAAKFGANPPWDEWREHTRASRKAHRTSG